MDNYDFVETVGEGTYGKVYKARVKANGRIVAIKKFKESDEDETVIIIIEFKKMRAYRLRRLF